MKRRLLILVLIAISAMSGMALRAAAQTGCDGTSGSATINGAPWSTPCVVAATSPSCVDSLGQDYECFQIIGSDSTGTYIAVAIFLAQAPVQGQTYSLGGTSGHGAMVLGQAGLWLTGDAPYTGQVHVTVYDPAHSNIECSFSFMARGLFGSDLTVTSGTFVGRLVGVEQKTWSDVKGLYRDRTR